MIEFPFELFRQFHHRLRISFFTKADDIRDDQSAATIIGAPEAAGLRQMHGNRTVVIRRPTSGRTEEADGMITDVPDLALCLCAADCQNFIVFEPQRNIAGVLHVGWRGLITNAIPEFFRILNKEFGISPEATFVGAGPSLCTQCADFTDPMRELAGVSREFIHGKHVDLQGDATAQMLKLGVSSDRIDRHPDCTRCHPELYWTYRGGDREAVKQGHSNMLVVALRVE